MKQAIAYLLSAVYLIYFSLILLLFHAAQFLAFTLGGRAAQKPVADWLNFSIVQGWILTGSTHRFLFNYTPPTDRPLIFVANHQSMFDISPIAWYLKRYTPVFVSKIELSRGTPSVSYNLRKSGAALIDRNDPRQALSEMGRLGQRLKEGVCSVVIFPEGTRSRDGKPKPFAGGGLAILLRKCPNALIVPIVIDGTGHFNPQGLFPLRPFSRMTWTVLPPIEPAGLTGEQVARQTQEAIQNHMLTT
ncbi:lysophospholipid acyltransferase family protein [Fibrella aquatica]|uniref:lysophospholipid acyltransferase family protein n=1 Tax=Fibrella aquatica TaxID=3242487 RepID=UPI0035201505